MAKTTACALFQVEEDQLSRTKFDRILLSEDLGDIGRLYKKTLEAQGIRVQTYSSNDVGSDMTAPKNGMYVIFSLQVTTMCGLQCLPNRVLYMMCKIQVK